MTTLDTFTASEIDVNGIRVAGDNPRETFSDAKLASLAQSIQAHGLQQPLIVSAPLPDAADGRYVLVAGERRLRAVKLLGWQSVPCRIAKTALTEKGAAIATVVENVEREDLSTYEMARACQILSGKYGMTGEEVGQVVRRNKYYVNNMLRCLRQLEPSIVAAWKAGHDAAKTDTLSKLAGVKDKAAQLRYWQMLRDGQDPFATVEEKDDAPDESDGADAPGDADGPTPPKKVKADTARALELGETLAAYKKAGGKDGTMAMECVRYILGKRKTNPIQVPDKAAELEKAADDILKGAQRPYTANEQAHDLLGIPTLKAPKGGAK
jgi:ParB/RepB/Spo0J family partition protein